MVRKIVILGGGVTGLVLAYELLKKGEKVVVLEKNNDVGGLARTLFWKDMAIDLGPHIYHTPDADIQEYWESEFENCFFEKEHWSKNYKNGKLYDYPISEELIESFDIDIQDKIKKELLEADPIKLKEANNYYEYIQALAGKTLQELFFIKYPEKVWGISTKELDANWAPKRIQIRKKSTPFYWGQWSAIGKEGSGTIINILKEKVINLGGDIRLGIDIESLDSVGRKISKIKSKNNEIILSISDLVINTTSYTQISRMLNFKTNLKYRGVILVYLHLSKVAVFPEKVDFIYIDSESFYFNRISDQNSFLKNPERNSTVVCCEITYNKDDFYDMMVEAELIEKVKEQFLQLGYVEKEEILDAKLVKLPEVYPMYSVGYRKDLSETKLTLDKYENLYNVGSLAEFAYSDLQVLFGKAIDLADVLTDKTFKINKIDKNTPRLSFNKQVEIAGKSIGSQSRAFIIAEIGLNHNGSMELAKKLIDEAINAGADAVKLQNYKSKNRVAKEGKTSRYVEKILGIEETDYEMFKKNELSIEDTRNLFDYARSKTIIFSAPFDMESVDELENLGIDCYKIASFDLVNLPLIKKIAHTGKPIIISTGMGTLSEIEDALGVISMTGNKNVIVLHCTSAYPCPPESMNIRAIDTIRQAFDGIPVGLSDHVIGDTVSLAAVARGANVIEKHFTMDKRLEGPDHVLSLEPDEMKLMVDRIRLIEESLGDGIKQPAPDEFSTMIRFRKTMYSSVEIKKGDLIKSDYITYKGPAYGLYARFEEMVVGQIASKDIKKDTPITWDCVHGI